MTHGQLRAYRGVIEQRDHGEAMDILFLAGDDPDCDDPLAERVADDIESLGSRLTVRYWIASEPLSDDAMRAESLRELLGAGDAQYGAHYSEYTGYLWTDEELTVGGHDLLEELSDHAGRYCLLEIEYAQDAS